MKKILSYLLLVLICLSISACNNSASFPSKDIAPSPLATNTLVPTGTNTPTPTLNPFSTTEVATVLDFRRNETMYRVVIATAHFTLVNSEIFDTLTPPPTYPPHPADAIRYQAKIKDVRDLDHDGEWEYIVLFNTCADFDCVHFESVIRIYKYDLEKDDYFIFDEYKTDPQKIEPKIIF